MSKHTFVPDPSVYPLHFDTAEEQQMREGFINVASQVSADEGLYQQDGTTLLAGIELELPLLNPDYTLASQAARDNVVNQVEYTSVELSAHQLEVTPDEPADLKSDLLSLEKAMAKAVASVQSVTRPLGLSWLRFGTYPLCHIREVDYTHGKEKYVRSPTWHTQNQRSELEGYVLTAAGPLDVSNGYVVGLMNAIQVTVDATDFDDAIDKLNRSYMISPMAVALAAHASHLGYLYTGYADVRFVAWSISHDTRTEEEAKRGFPTRVGLPTRYFESLNDYFNQILSYPFVMNDPISLQHPFEVGNGIFWRDARLKFFRDKGTLGIEFRPVSLQPSLHEDVAMMLFYIGRLLWSQHTREPLTPMHVVRYNKESAMMSGMRAKLYTNIDGELVSLPASQALAVELQRAKYGLEMLESDEKKRLYYLDSLSRRINEGSPAERFIGVANHKIARNIQDARDNLIESIEELNLMER